MENTISVIIPVMNEIAYTRQIINEIQKLKSEEIIEIIIIDNGSTDGTKEFINTIETSMAVIYRRFEKNLGVNFAWNTGAQLARGKYLWFLNNDILLTKNIQKELINLLSTGKKIACPLSTVGRRKFQLPLVRNTDNICGWCFMVKREDYVYIPHTIKIWYGDNFLYWKLKKDVGWAGRVHHFGSVTVGKHKKEIQEILDQDKKHWEDICLNNNWRIGKEEV